MAKPSHLALVRNAEPGDPIFEAIERHRRLSAIWEAAVERESELEGKDDAAFIEAERVTEKLTTDRKNAGFDLVRTQPTTIEGVVSLLNYYAETIGIWDGTYWPDNINFEPGDYGAIIARQAAAALERITQSA